MASHFDKSKIITPYMPSLFHLSLIQVVAPLFNEFGCKILTAAYKDVRRRNLLAPNKDPQKNNDVIFMRAKESLLFVPWPFREKVMDAVKNMQREVTKWRRDHSHIFGFEFVECDFYWRADGTIDTTKTAEKLVLNKDIHILKRFDMACNYSLGDNMHALWAEVEAAGETEAFEKTSDDLFLFWIEWIHYGSSVHWSEAIRLYLTFPWKYSISMPTFSSIFPLLQPKERRKFLCCLHTTSLDDLRQCLHMVTKKEEEEILQRNIQRVLKVYLETWPLQSKFLEMSEKLRKYIDSYSFCILLEKILKLSRKNVNFKHIFEVFWSRGSESFREYAEEWSWYKSYPLYKEIIRRWEQQ